MASKPIDVAMALAMREEGLSFRTIGRELAEREGRFNAYQPQSVEAALRKFLEKLDA